MNFLLDMNVPRELGRLLASEGHTWRHVGDIGLAQASDTAILEEAGAANEVILTHDLDYGNLLAFSGQSVPSVIILRFRNMRPENVVACLAHLWPAVEAPLAQGAIVTLDDGAYRIRRLPIRRDE